MEYVLSLILTDEEIETKKLNHLPWVLWQVSGGANSGTGFLFVFK